MKRLAGRVVLVTGAAHGAGAAIAEAFAGAGARVVVTDIDESAGRAVAERLGTSWMALDVREEMAWIAALARLLDSHGRLDVLVNGAGLGSGSPVRGPAHDPEHASLADWQAVLRTHLDGVFLGCKHALRAMRRSGGGSIINVAALAAHPDATGPTAAAALAASTAAVRQHTATVALYAAEQGLAVRCHGIHSGAGFAPLRAADVAAQALRLV